MDHGIMLFLHLGSLSVWVGSVIMTVLLLLSLKNNIQSPDISVAVRNVVKIVNRVTHPTAFIVMLSGIFMLMGDAWGMENHDSFPFWIKFMEQAGSMVILIFIVAIFILGRKLVGKLAAGDVAAARRGIRRYVLTSIILMAGVMAIVYIVSVKFA